jgi:CRP-like cAMP-binding protein
MLWTTGNDVLPFNNVSYIMCSIFLFIASLINANLMGTIAVIA